MRRNYAPLWVSNNAGNERAKAAIAYLAQADAVGLDPSDYPHPRLQIGGHRQMRWPKPSSNSPLPRLRSRATHRSAASISPVSPRTFSMTWSRPIQPTCWPSLPTVTMPARRSTASIRRSQNSRRLRPSSPSYARVRLPPIAKAEEKSEQLRVQVPDGKILRPGMKDARVVALRKRLDVAGDKENPLYDDGVRDAVKTFQTESDIGVDGNLGPNTVRALNGEKKEARHASADPIDTIIVNMERWRWLPRNLGNPHVIVNVPDYTLTLYNDGKVYWKTKIVAGKPGMATPMVSAEMKFITVNPTWNVPPSIIENEYLPALGARSTGSRSYRP